MAEEVAQALQATLSADARTRHQGEAFLRQAARASDQFASQLLQLSTASASSSVSSDVRLAAAVAFKNAVKHRWNAPPEEDPGTAVGESPLPPIPQHEHDTIKPHLLQLCLQCTDRISAQLSEALCAIASHDFPSQWSDLLPALVQYMSTADLPSCTKVLSICNTIFHRYRFQFKSEELYTELAYVLDRISGPLLSLIQAVNQAVPSATDASTLSKLFEAVYYIVEIVFSVSSIDLPEWIENRLDQFLTEFHTLLQTESPILDQNTSPDNATTLDNARASICDCLRMFADMYEEEITPYVSTFAHDVWNLLTRASSSEGKDSLVTTAMSFLSALARGVHYQLFSDTSALEKICSQVVLPNLRFRSEDEQMLEMSPLDYMRRETEGSDSDTRRRMGSELVKTLSERFPDTVMPALSQYIRSLLQEYASNPSVKWKEKDMALQLAISLMAREITAARGATSVNEMMSLHEFFTTNVAPEICSSAGSSPLVVQADCLKFLVIFRSQLSKQLVAGVFPYIVNLTGSQEIVLHSYAAFAIERLLALREKQSSHKRFSLADLGGSQQAQLVQTALKNMFACMQLEDSSENDYLMKAVMRLITAAGTNMTPMAPTCIEQLSAKLETLCKSGTNPAFAHFLFESLAAIIKAVGSDTIPQLEGYLFPPFQEVLQQDIAEFAPYVFQLFGLLVELRPRPLTETYTQLLGPVLTKDTWSRKANVPALVKLLKAFMKNAPQEMQSHGRVEAILGVFQTLVKSKAHDHDAFMLINAVLESLPADAWQQHFATVMGEVLSRLHRAPSTRFKSDFVVFFALSVLVLGWDKVSEVLESFQSGLSLMILQQVWIPSMTLAMSHWLERKMLAVVGVRLLEQCTQLRTEQAGSAWQNLLTNVVNALEDKQGKSSTIADEDDAQDAEPQQYTAAYAALSMAAKREGDPCSDVTDPQLYVAQALGRIQQQQPVGWVSSQVQHALTKDAQDALSHYCARAGLQLQ